MDFVRYVGFGLLIDKNLLKVFQFWDVSSFPLVFLKNVGLTSFFNTSIEKIKLVQDFLIEPSVFQNLPSKYW